MPAAMTITRFVSWVVSLSVSTATDIDHKDTIPKYLANYGIEVEQHTVVTDDDYILTAFRLPQPGAPVVLMQHGILSSAWCWIDNDPEIAPAIQLFNMGYDVWLTNNRGNTFSRQHKTLNPTLSKKFWDFSFADLARYDVPANIDHILSTTGKNDLTYIGHSQGTSQFFAAMVDPKTKSELEKKVNLFIALAPVAYLNHQSALLLKIIGDLHLGDAIEAAFPYGFLAFDQLSAVSELLCKLTAGVVCDIGVAIVCGDSKEDTSAAITNISAHFPAGTSVKSMNHYEQLMLSGHFEDYDYGQKGNLDKYGTNTPPAFDLTQAQVPTAMFIGSEDTLGDPTDAERAASEIPSSTLVYSQQYRGYSHITWIAGTWASFQAWFPKAQNLLQKYNPLQSQTLV